jgi:predicted kinase
MVDGSAKLDKDQMKRTLYMLRGLPASGKSTHRTKMMNDSFYQPLIAVNKDQIRKEKGIKPGDFKREKEVQAEESRRITETLDNGWNLIVDNTHNSPRYLERYKQLAKEYGYEFILIDLSNVPVEECIRRDALRPEGERVGEAVIMRMYNEHYNPNTPKKENKPPHVDGRSKKCHEEKPKQKQMKQDITLPRAVIVDLDGTLADKTDRTWYQYWKCETDVIIQPIYDILLGLRETNTVEHFIFLTGREDSGRQATTNWLRSIGFDLKNPKFHLLMKTTGDHRQDTETKLELFDNNVRDKFFVYAVFEDRQRVVQMFRQMGLFVLDVNQEVVNEMDK